MRITVTVDGTTYTDEVEPRLLLYLALFFGGLGYAFRKLDLPKAREADSTSLVVQVTPSLAVTMLDALPYLIDYPYGCTEQTMSRLVPVVVAKAARDRRR